MNAEDEPLLEGHQHRHRPFLDLYNWIKDTMTDEHPPTDSTDYEQEFEDLDETVILVQILAELQQIRMTLTTASDGAQSDASDDPAYRCRKCDTTVPADARERHAAETHKAPPGMADEMFERVE